MTKQNQLDALGNKSNIPNYPDKNILEKVNNPKKDIDYSIRLTCPEFTSICPVTSQPDFAYIILDYIPNKFIVESKSFKLYLLGYRNHGAFHEDCTISLAQDIIDLLSPKWLRIALQFQVVILVDRNEGGGHAPLFRNQHVVSAAGGACRHGLQTQPRL